MNADVLQSLIAAGLAPADASRLAESLDNAYRQQPSASAPESPAVSASASQGRQQLAEFSVPLVAQAGLVSSKGAQFSGDNTFLGPVTFSGRMFWDGERRPANVQVISFAAAENNTVLLKRSNVAVLNAYGDEPRGVLTYSLPIWPSAQTLVTGLSATSSYISCNNITAATIRAAQISCVTNVGSDTVSVVGAVTTSGLSVLTAVTFDATNCTVTQVGTTIYGVVGIDMDNVNQVASVSRTQIWAATTNGVQIASAATTANYFSPLAITHAQIANIYALTGTSISIQAS